MYLPPSEKIVYSRQGADIPRPSLPEYCFIRLNMSGHLTIGVTGQKAGGGTRGASSPSDGHWPVHIGRRATHDISRARSKFPALVNRCRRARHPRSCRASGHSLEQPSRGAMDRPRIHVNFPFEPFPPETRRSPYKGPCTERRPQ
jgi:hypothetical protein